MRGKNVCAFIDRDPALQGTDYHGTPIVRFDEFLAKYRECIVIVTPINFEYEIQKLLTENHIHFLPSLFLPPEIIEVPVPDVLERIDEKIKDRTAYLYGLNLYSILLLDHYRTIGGRTIRLIPEAVAEEWLIEAVKESYPDSLASLDEASNVYLTSNRYITEKVLERNPVNIYDFMYDIEGYYHPEIEKFKNAHLGKRCFVIGTGPSLEIWDLDTLRDNGELCISVNGIIKAYPSTAWRPDYYMITDRFGYKRYKKDLLTDCGVENMLIADTALRGDEANGFLPFHISLLPILKDCPTLFSEDVSRGVYAGGQVVYAAAQFAVYFGCSEIYLYGIDHDYSNAEHAHFSDDYCAYTEESAATPMINESNNFIEISFKSAKRAAEQRGIKIYNASRRTKLDVFECVDFDSLFDGGPIRF